MLGVIVNAGAIIICSLLGCFAVRGIPERFEETIKKAIGLSIVYVGIRGALENQHILLLIMSMVGGAIIGELINIDRLMNRFGLWAEKKLGMSGGTFAKGFVAASILFCSGSMAIVGSMQSGLSGNHETLFAKSILDGAISLVFAASMGIGVACSAIPVFLYQGTIVVVSWILRDFLSPDTIREMGAVGNLLVAAIGFNFLGTKEIRVANLIPAIFIPWIYLTITGIVLSTPYH
ncbi:membrane protein [Spirochaetia bacterium]|nr:membrane protein [Spirochaetia bacterium]GHU33198.1 membrane protein [Spirochaetia bacterium]